MEFIHLNINFQRLYLKSEPFPHRGSCYIGNSPHHQTGNLCTSLCMPHFAWFNHFYIHFGPKASHHLHLDIHITFKYRSNLIIFLDIYNNLGINCATSISTSLFTATWISFCTFIPRTLIPLSMMYSYGSFFCISLKFIQVVYFFFQIFNLI